MLAWWKIFNFPIGTSIITREIKSVCTTVILNVIN